MVKAGLAFLSGPVAMKLGNAMSDMASGAEEDEHQMRETILEKWKSLTQGILAKTRLEEAAAEEEHEAAKMQGGGGAGHAALQPVAQEIGEQAVIAIAALLPLRRRQQDVARGQRHIQP